VHLVHRRHVPTELKHVRELLRELIAECTKAGLVRDDVAPQELASYCVHALAGAAHTPSKAAIRRLVTVTLDGLRAH
jgi:hypothetical protein